MADTCDTATKVALEQQLTDRPSAEDLERRGIIKPGGNISDARSTLERNLTKVLVNRQILKRPDYDDLVQSNIVYDANLAPSLHAQARALERNLRCDQLNAALQHRQPLDRIQQILPAERVAPRLRSAQIALEQAIARDQLKRKLEQRPAVDTLLKNNILKAPPHVAPALHATQVELEKQLRLDHLNEFMAGRGSTPPDEVASALQGPQRDLQRNLARSNLYHALQHRPSPDQIQQSGIMVDNHTDNHDQEQHDRQLAETLGQRQDDPYDQRARSFILSRTLLKLIVMMTETGEITPAQKGALKDLVVDQDAAMLAAADLFDADGDLVELKDTLIRLSYRR